jgi:hypothetical protein
MMINTRGNAPAHDDRSLAFPKRSYVAAWQVSFDVVLKIIFLGEVIAFYQPAHNKKRRVAQVMREAAFLPIHQNSCIWSIRPHILCLANTIPFIAFLDLLLFSLGAFHGNHSAQSHSH